MQDAAVKGTADVMKVLALSTANLPERLGADGLEDVGQIGVESIEGGWFIYVPEDPHEWGLPAELVTVLDYAKANGCRYIHMHADNGIDPALPAWDW